MITSEEICKSLRESGLANGPATADTIDSCDKPFKFDKAAAAQIQKIYGYRSQHLAAKQSEHARQLKHSIDELLQGIEARNVQSLLMLDIPADGLGSYLIWFDAESHDAIGCFYAISQLEVSAAEWKRIWGDS